MQPLRQAHVPLVKGKVLDIGIGTGSNTQFYPAGAVVTLTDISERMLHLAEIKAKNLHRTDLKLNFLVADAEHLPFPDETFDSIISVDMMCSIRHPLEALKECRRVLRTGGRAYFVEHGRKKLANWKDRVLFVLSVMGTCILYPLAGISLIRDHETLIRKSGFIITEICPHNAMFSFHRCEKQNFDYLSQE
eukprot:ANDGO_07265.mRNA.1 Phosphatidylethanolamine N-methyltransferase